MGFFDFFKETKPSPKTKPRSITMKPDSRTSATLDARHTHSQMEARERRNEERHTTYLSTIVKHNNQDSFSTIIDCSKNGFGLLSGKPFKENDIFDLVLSMNNGAPLSVRLQVQSCYKQDDEYFIGTKITDYCPLHNDFFEALTQTKDQNKSA